MEKRRLGKTLEVSAVGLGCMGFSHAYGAPTERAEAIRTIQKAYDLGYTFFDTAEVYGTQEDPHVNEELVGEALKAMRDHVQIVTKFGIRFDMGGTQVNHPLIPDSRPEVIRRSVEGSLKRLQTDHIDLYFQHRIDPATEPEVVAGVMADLIKEGKILHWGISEAEETYLRRAHAVCPVTAVENRYSMMARHYESLFPVLEELKIGLVAFSPVANGFLSGAYGKGAQFDKKLDYRSNMPQFTDEAVDQNQELLRLLHRLAKTKDATPAQIALAWMLCKKPWIVPIPGTRKPERLEENAKAAEVKFLAEEITTIDEALNHMEMSAVFGGSQILKTKE
ncbi:MAG: aldo/keto reductase [Lachnospiraceae bacterium]|nr:aldo/keto reductase [Lachnospiraceae bacterium]